MGRGNRQGTNAFCEDKEPIYMNPTQYDHDQDFTKFVAVNWGQKINIKTLELLEKIRKSMVQNWFNNLAIFLKNGNNTFAAYLIGDKYKLENYGMNQLHYEALKIEDVDELFDFH